MPESCDTVVSSTVKVIVKEEVKVKTGLMTV